jgi:hypothetical protein
MSGFFKFLRRNLLTLLHMERLTKRPWMLDGFGDPLASPARPLGQSRSGAPDL